MKSNRLYASMMGSMHQIGSMERANVYIIRLPRHFSFVWQTCLTPAIETWR